MGGLVQRDCKLYIMSCILNADLLRYNKMKIMGKYFFWGHTFLFFFLISLYF